MSARYLFAMTILAGLLASLLYQQDMWPFAGSSALDGQEGHAVEALLATATQDIVHTAPAACASALARAAGGELDENDEDACIVALAVLPDAQAHGLAAAVIEKTRGSLALTMALETAARLDQPAAWLDAAIQLRAAAGPAGAGYQQIDPPLFSAARTAARRAATAGSPQAEVLLQEMESTEFPLPGVPHEALWRSLYFGRFTEIKDSTQVRHLVAGMAFALGDLCAQWEPPGIRSVEFATGLETYLAPLRAQVPGRIVASLPKVGSALRQSYEDAREEPGERSAEQWLTTAYRAVQNVRKHFQNSVALGSISGRDSAQRLFNNVQSCRSPRGVQFIGNLTRYFQYTAQSQPGRPALPTAAPN